MEEQLEFDFSDIEPTKERKVFSFDGMSSHSVSFDPSEFVGMPVVAISAEIKAVLASIAPGVSFFDQELEDAARELSAPE